MSHEDYDYDVEDSDIDLMAESAVRKRHKHTGRARRSIEMVLERRRMKELLRDPLWDEEE